MRRNSESFRNAYRPLLLHLIALYWRRARYSLAVLSLDAVLDLDEDDEEDDFSFSFLISLEEGLALMESINRAVPINSRYPAIPTPIIRNESAHWYERSKQESTTFFIGFSHFSLTLNVKKCSTLTVSDSR